MLTALAIPDVILIRPPRLGDTRGWFSETFSVNATAQYGFPLFIQDNESLSTQIGTVRGLHFQRAPFAQAKLVRCIRGAVFEVVLDIRPGSPTFGHHLSMQLDFSKGDQLLIPAGFAHGFCTLEPDTLIQYKVSAPYAPQHEGGIAWDDPALGIKWPVSAAKAIVSERDRRHPRLAESHL